MEKSDFYKFIITYIQNEINRIDIKANILIAIQVAIFTGLLSFIEKTKDIPKLSFLHDKITCISILYGFITLLIIVLLIICLRPKLMSWFYKERISKYNSIDLIWPRKKCPDHANITKECEELTQEKMEMDYQSSIYNLQWNIYRKMQYYRKSISIILIEIISIPLLLAIVFLLKFICCH